jgi:hypothetical protein
MSAVVRDSSVMDDVALRGRRLAQFARQRLVRDSLKHAWPEGKQ